MAEDQGVNGDIWNEEASRLLKKIGWIQIGDGNVDVINEVGDKHGIDRLFKFEDGRRLGLSQGVFVEAKRYLTTSFNKSLLEDWIRTLSKKLVNVRNSSTFYNTYPDFENSILRSGLIVLWFSDLDNYPKYRHKFLDILKTTRAPAGNKADTINRIYVLDNYHILRLASLYTTINHYNNENSTSLKFYYPFSERFGNVSNRTLTLSIDYMFSKFILAESNTAGVENKIVFYFGKLSKSSFERLKSALQYFHYVDKDKPLTIYTYDRDSDFRKIKPDILSLFQEVKFELKEMDIFSDVPVFMKS